MTKLPLVTDSESVRIEKMVEEWWRACGGMFSDVGSAAKAAVREYIANSEGKTCYPYRASDCGDKNG